MLTKRFRWAVAAMLAALVLPLVACGGSGQRQGRRDGQGQAARPHSGQRDRRTSRPLTSWAEQVGRLSDGTLRIEFENEWRRW